MLEKLTQAPSAGAVQGAGGRTDAGVLLLPARCGKFRDPVRRSAREISNRALNALLPPAIRVVAVDEVAPDFHARWSALAKTYRYRIFRSRVVPPFHWRYVQHDSSPLNFDAMAEAARAFEGEHDFASFAASTGSDEEDWERTTIRTIYRSEWMRSAGNDSVSGGEEWVYTVRGKSFLRYMVRNMGRNSGRRGPWGQAQTSGRAGAF